MQWTTTRLHLRPLDRTDAEAHYSVIDSDPQVTWLGTARSRDEGRRYVAAKAAIWEQHPYGPWAVIERASGTFLGHGGLEPLEETGEVQLSYYLGRPAWGQGYASELGRAAVDFGWRHLTLPRIAAIVRPHNTASQRVLQKLGFQHERTGQYSSVEAQYWALTRPQHP